MENIFIPLMTQALHLCLIFISDALNQRCDAPLLLCLQVKSYYNVMMETIKQTSFQNTQGDLGGHVDALGVKDAAGTAQQALTLVDVEASVMEVSLGLSGAPVRPPPWSFSPRL